MLCTDTWEPEPGKGTGKLIQKMKLQFQGGIVQIAKLRGEQMERSTGEEQRKRGERRERREVDEAESGDFAEVLTVPRPPLASRRHNLRHGILSARRLLALL